MKSPRNYRPRPNFAFRWRMFWWTVSYRVRRPFEIVGEFLARIFTVYRVAALLALIGVALWYFNRVSMRDLLPNIIIDLLSVALTVFIIDTMYRIRSDTEQKKVLIEKLGSSNNAVATDALHELDARGWLLDGSLHRAHLTSCNLDGNSLTGADLERVSFSFGSLRKTSWLETNLQGAWLDHTDLTDAHFTMYDPEIDRHIEADITGASFFRANLRGARIRPEQLCKVKTLWRATMPDGSLYDGRYNLPDDIPKPEDLTPMPTAPIDWAAFYGVTPHQYLGGQLWAMQNLERVRGKVSA